MKRCEKCGAFLGKNHSCEKIKKKHSKTQKKMWEDEEYREHMSHVHKGQHSSPKTEFKEGDPITKYWLGKKRPNVSEYNRKHKSEQMKGEKHPNWQGGKSFEPYGIEFFDIRELALERDNFRCVNCGAKRILCVHHIDKNKLNNDVENLITLCRSCHMKLHWREKQWIRI